MVDSGSHGFIFEQLVFVLIEFRRKSISFCHLKSANFCVITFSSQCSQLMTKRLSLQICKISTYQISILFSFLFNTISFPSSCSFLNVLRLVNAQKCQIQKLSRPILNVKIFSVEIYFKEQKCSRYFLNEASVIVNSKMQKRENALFPGSLFMFYQLCAFLAFFCTSETQKPISLKMYCNVKCPF